MGHGRLRMRQMGVNVFDAEYFNSEHNNGVNLNNNMTTFWEL